MLSYYISVLFFKDSQFISCFNHIFKYIISNFLVRFQELYAPVTEVKPGITEGNTDN